MFSDDKRACFIRNSYSIFRHVEDFEQTQSNIIIQLTEPRGT